jgi:1-acyl-sn-glycerol-3-phosphate acyltransferase
MTATASVKRVRLPYETSPAVYRVIKWIFDRLMHILYRYEVTSLGPFPASGPTIIAVNHLHLFDPGAVAPVVPRQIVTLAAEKYMNNLLIGSLLRLAGSIFVRRGEVDREALRWCLNVLSKGGVLAVAPEGTRSRTGAMQRAKPGIAYLALRTNATIVPIAFWGIERLKDWAHLRRPTCQVVIGNPFRLPQLTEKPNTEKLQELADLIMLRIGLLLPESYRGVYATRIAAIEAGQSDELAALRTS